MTRTVPPLTVKLPAQKSVKSTKVSVPVEHLHVLEGLNVRVDLPNLDALIASIAANGFYADKPIAAYHSDEGYIVVDGHRRLAAVLKLNADSLDGPIVTHLPVVVKPTGASLADIHIAQVQSATGEPLTMFEKGLAVRRIMADGMSKEDVANAFGVTTKTIDNYVQVASAPVKARDLLLDGKVRDTHVLRAMSQKDPAAALQAMVDKAAGKGRTVARAGDAKPAPAVAPPAVVEPTFTITDDDALTFDILGGQTLGRVIQQIAQAIRANVPHDGGEDDTAHQNGRITLRVELADPLAHTLPTDDEL